MDWNVSTPTEWVTAYNGRYRDFWGRDSTYAEVLDHATGAFNTNVIKSVERYAANELSNASEVTLRIIGKKANQHFARRNANIARFLLARLIYNDGLNTLFAFGGIYAAGTFGMTLNEVLLFGIALNVSDLDASHAFWTEIVGNFAEKSCAFCATATATLRAIAL